jgi:hypothetical protein
MPMRFPYLKAARVKLQERKNACLRADYTSADKYAGQFLAFVRSDSVVRTIIGELSVIIQAKFSDLTQHIDPHQQFLVLPPDRVECAAFHLRLIERLADPNPQAQIPGFRTMFGRGSNTLQDTQDHFYEQVLQPLCSYIDERIDDGDLLLYMLCRYQRECAWFENDTLSSLAENADSRSLEDTLDSHLRSWLFREGIDYPFSTPRSPSGRADIVVWEGEEPLAIEVKVFDGQSRDCGHIRQGLWQAHRYASDYSKPFGYLVVFNTSGDLLSFQGNVAVSGPPIIPVGDRNVFAVTVGASARTASASKEKALKTQVVETPVGK